MENRVQSGRYLAPRARYVQIMNEFAEDIILQIYIITPCRERHQTEISKNMETISQEARHMGKILLARIYRSIISNKVNNLQRIEDHIQPRTIRSKCRCTGKGVKIEASQRTKMVDDAKEKRIPLAARDLPGILDSSEGSSAY